MTEATRRIEWDRTDGNGKTVVQIKSARGYQMEHYRHNLDGDIIEGDKQVVVEIDGITLTTAGKSYQVYDVTARFGKIGRPAQVADADLILSDGQVNIGIKADNAAKVRAALAEVKAEAEADPEWTEILAHRAEIADAERHQRNVERMMTLNGHTY